MKYVAVVGCSAGGDFAVPRLFDGLEFDSSAIVLVPHIYEKHIHDILISQGVNSVAFSKDVNLEPGRVHLLNTAALLNEGKFYFRIGFEENTIKVYRGDRRIISAGPISDIMISAAREYKAKTLGLVLSGASDDCSRGVVEIKKYQGRVFVQHEEREGMHYVSEMGTFSLEALRNEGFYPDYLGSLDGMVDVLSGVLR